MVFDNFTSTCQRLGIEPWQYLRDVLERLPSMPAGQLSNPLPEHWQAARQGKVASPPATTETAIPSAESCS